MNRRNFIKKTGLAAAGAMVLPSLLPSGRLFASTGARKANHVVFCLFAGGVRNLESMQKKDGNLLRYTLNGSEAISSDIIGGMSTIPSPPGLPLQNYGTLFKEFRYKSGPTGHFNGHTVAMTGVYTGTDLNLKTHPENPTVFEFYRKHTSPSQSALKSWWISNTLGPYPALNYSNHYAYGATYGANYMQPTSIISKDGYDALGNPKKFTGTEETAAKKIRQLCDSNFSGKPKAGDAGIINTEADAKLLDTFISKSYTEALAGQYNNPWGLGFMSNDMYNVFYAEKIIQEFKPELLVVNMQDIDVCHFNFTQYCDNIRRADYALAHLWNTIQSTPGMANDTILIVAPEHGRNLTANSQVDSNGRYALDHSGDSTSREIFCLILGPTGVVKQNQVITSVTGESIDIVPTIANVLGFDTDIPQAYRNQMGNPLLQAFN